MTTQYWVELGKDEFDNIGMTSGVFAGEVIQGANPSSDTLVFDKSDTVTAGLRWTSSLFKNYHRDGDWLQVPGPARLLTRTERLQLIRDNGGLVQSDARPGAVAGAEEMRQ